MALAKEILDKLHALIAYRQRAYQLTFNAEHGKNVLADLAKFCRAHESTFHMNERAAGRLDGRREVWLRIQHQLQLTDEQLWELYGRKIDDA